MSWYLFKPFISIFLVPSVNPNNQEEPGGARKKPGPKIKKNAVAKRSQKDPGGAKKSQEEPAGARKSQEEQEAGARGSQEEPGRGGAKRKSQFNSMRLKSQCSVLSVACPYSSKELL